MNKLINITGLILTFLGSLSFARGFFISKKEALRLGVSRWSSDKEEENLKLPQVQDRLKQRRWGFVGAILVTIGFLLQLFALI